MAQRAERAPGTQWSPDRQWRWTGSRSTPSSLKVLSAVLFAFGAIVTFLVLKTGYTYYSWRSAHWDPYLNHTYSYPKSFGVYYDENVWTWLVTIAALAITVAATYAAYRWGWKSLASAVRYARRTFWLGLGMVGVGVVAAINGAVIAISNGNLTHIHYSWWLGEASYGVLVAGIVFTAIGLAATRLMKSPPASA